MHCIVCYIQTATERAFQTLHAYIIINNTPVHTTSGVFKISKGGGKCSLATSAHKKGVGKPSFSIFLPSRKKIVWPKRAMADLAKG